MTRAFVTTSFPILFTTDNPAHNWSLILCLFWVQKCGTLLGLDSKAKISPKFDPTRRVSIVMARLVVLVSGLSLASPIPDPRNGKHPCCSDCTCLLTCFLKKYTSMLLLCDTAHAPLCHAVGALQETRQAIAYQICILHDVQGMRETLFVNMPPRSYIRNNCAICTHATNDNMLDTNSRRLSLRHRRTRQVIYPPIAFMHPS